MAYDFWVKPLHDFVLGIKISAEKSGRSSWVGVIGGRSETGECLGVGEEVKVDGDAVDYKREDGNICFRHTL